MTLGTMESLLNLNETLVFSDLILQQSREKKHGWDLSHDAPLFELLHPKVIKALLHYMKTPDAAPVEEFKSDEWRLQTFANIEEARLSYPHTDILKGHVWVFADLSKVSHDPVLVDFESLGVAALSHNKLPASTVGLHQHLLPIWLNYATSPDLWSSYGKWPRFHERLVNIFKSRNLLQPDSTLGKYKLNPSTQKLEKFGFKGSLEDGSYTLILPWTFPLTALKDLETIVLQEF